MALWFPITQWTDLNFVCTEKLYIENNQNKLNQIMFHASNPFHLNNFSQFIRQANICWIFARKLSSATYFIRTPSMVGSRKRETIHLSGNHFSFNKYQLQIIYLKFIEPFHSLSFTLPQQPQSIPQSRLFQKDLESGNFLWWKLNDSCISQKSVSPRDRKKIASKQNHPRNVRAAVGGFDRVQVITGRKRSYLR